MSEVGAWSEYVLYACSGFKQGQEVFLGNENIINAGILLMGCGIEGIILARLIHHAPGIYKGQGLE